MQAIELPLRRRRARCRNESMWQLESDATNIPSGSPAASTAHLPTTWGEADAGTSVPPSKLIACARLKRPLRNSSPLSFAAHLIVATWVAMSPPLLSPGRPLALLRSSGEHRTRRLKWIKNAGAEFIPVNRLRRWTHGALDERRRGSLAEGLFADACGPRRNNRQEGERHGCFRIAHRRWRPDGDSRRERTLRSGRWRRSDRQGRGRRHDGEAAGLHRDRPQRRALSENAAAVDDRARGRRCARARAGDAALSAS